MIHLIFFPNRGFLGDKILFEPIIRLLKSLDNNHSVIGIEWSSDIISMMEFPVPPFATFVIHSSMLRRKHYIKKFIAWLKLIQIFKCNVISYIDKNSDSMISDISSYDFLNKRSLWETLEHLYKSKIFPQLEIPSWAISRVHTIAKNFPLDLNDNYITLHIRTLNRDVDKNLNFEKYLTIAQKIVEEFEMKVIFIGRDDKFPLLNKMNLIFDNMIIDIRDKLDSIWETAYLVKKAFIHIGGDTGLTHLAASIGSKIITVERKNEQPIRDYGPFCKSNNIEKLTKENSNANLILEKICYLKNNSKSQTYTSKVHKIIENKSHHPIHIISNKNKNHKNSRLPKKIEYIKMFTSLSSSSGSERAVELYNKIMAIKIPNSIYFPLRVNKLDKCINTLKNLPIGGFSVSQPFKSNILKYVDELDSEVEEIGAANTCININGKWIAHNTDWKGVIQCLDTVTSLIGKTVIVFGCGGVAKAICYGLKNRGCKIIVCCRKIGEAKNLWQYYGLEGYNDNNNVSTFKADIFINATSLGSKKNDNVEIFEKLVPKSTEIIFDVVFEPRITPLNRLSKRRKCLFISGWEMLKKQALHQIDLFARSEIPFKVNV